MFYATGNRALEAIATGVNSFKEQPLVEVAKALEDVFTTVESSPPSTIATQLKI
ncbi:hypothetical protein CERSUDRAFT_92231 [Gelatoporia subvermispora B]|uniref:Uncharacterized protein n=1 Tax=Ceriporiopsis subvermispora (strain B) TaxID=914234 RepID=M2PST3_CERS8|nr:hypothetical protein CERSUDRAFT_92231 [Gelatoporia subvermispora B]